MPTRPVAEGLFEQTHEGPRLIGGRRLDDGAVVFPMPTGAEAAYFEPIRLPDQGLLWSYTVQRFRPKSPPYVDHAPEADFKPFALGYVELPGSVIVESRLLVEDFSSLKVGLPMALRLTPYRTDPDGVEVVTFSFASV